MSDFIQYLRLELSFSSCLGFCPLKYSGLSVSLEARPDSDRKKKETLPLAGKRDCFDAKNLG